jgi:hypothetical protein
MENELRIMDHQHLASTRHRTSVAQVKQPGFRCGTYQIHLFPGVTMQAPKRMDGARHVQRSSGLFHVCACRNDHFQLRQAAFRKCGAQCAAQFQRKPLDAGHRPVEEPAVEHETHHGFRVADSGAIAPASRC